MADEYVTRKELMEVLRVFSQELSKSLGDRIEKIMTQQTDRLLMVLDKYEELTEKHDKNFKNIKKVIDE